MYETTLKYLLDFVWTNSFFISISLKKIISILLIKFLVYVCLNY